MDIVDHQENEIQSNPWDFKPWFDGFDPTIENTDTQSETVLITWNPLFPRGEKPNLSLHWFLADLGIHFSLGFLQREMPIRNSLFVFSLLFFLYPR